jgi:chemotaxis protein MotB
MTTLAPNTALIPGLPAQAPRRLWLITFVDLVMLLLGFFVLIFSMSSLNTARYATIVRSYADVFHGVGGMPATAVGPLRVPHVERTPGDDLAYLETVLRTNFAREDSLSAIQFRLTAQYLILLVPAQTAAGAGLGDFDAETKSRFFELGGVLSNLPNRIAILAPATSGDNAAAWSQAAARARSVQAALESAGYQRGLTGFVQGSVNTDENHALPPIQIMIFPETSSVTRPGAEATP